MTKKSFFIAHSQNDFDRFLEALHQQHDAEWKWLLGHFRQLVLPWIRKKIGHLPAGSIVSEAYYVEEIFAQSLIKFYELFATGSFENLGQLRGLMFRISEFKIKEAYKKNQRDRLIYFPGEDQTIDKEIVTLADDEIKQRELVKSIEEQLKCLPNVDREIITRFYRGEKLKDIAKDLKIGESNCRKRKQRALEQLKKLLPDSKKKYKFDDDG